VFTLSKIFGFLAQPSSIAMLLAVAGVMLWHRRPRVARWLAGIGIGVLLVAGIVPVGNWLIAPLEARASALSAAAAEGPVAGILILGGFEDGWVSAGRGQLAVNESAERLTEGLRLARRHPEALVVFTGGVGTVFRAGAPAAGVVGGYLEESGIAPERIRLEGASRNTHENALFSASLLAPKPGQRWLLVTSAYHMPRAVGVFRRAGFEVAPHAVDYRTRGPEDGLRLFESVPAGLLRFDLAAKEWIGLIAYRLLGRTDSLLPGT
jgi:uncharacterized SAM-binding protein YcdF (DUF218 family)